MAKLERYGHGGDIVTAAEIFGTNAQDFIDFSSNIYPYGPPKAAMERLHGLLSEPGWSLLTRYPDPDSRKLKQAIAAFHQIDAGQILVGNGAAECIDLLISVLQPERVGVIEPAFAEYSVCAKKRKIPVISVITSWDNRFCPSVAETIRLIEQTELVFVGTPNNPTGHLLPFSLLEKMAASAAQAGTWLVLDEAFIDFLPDGEMRSFIHQLHRFPTTIVVRSMTKFYALPGLRLGYLVACASVIQSLKRMQIPWSVNGLAQEVGCVVLDRQVHKAFAEEVVGWLSQEKEWLTAQLKEMGTFELFPGEANYILLRFRENTSTYSAPWLQEQLGKKGFLIRDCSMYQGLNERYFRLAVKTRSAHQALVNTLKNLFLRKEG